MGQKGSFLVVWSLLALTLSASVSHAQRERPYVQQQRTGDLFEEAKAYYQAGKYDDAKRLFEQAARRGHFNARMTLARMCELGQGGPVDYSAAFAIYRDLALDHHGSGAYMAGLYCERGIGTEKSYERAADFYQQAADHGKIPEAMRALGSLYFRGAGVPKDYAEAFKWYKDAAERKNHRGAFNLAVMYEKGLGCEADIKKALEWYRKSAEWGNAKAHYYLGLRYELGDEVEKNIDEAVNHYTEAVKGEYVDAMVRLASLYRAGKDVTRDYGSAFQLYGRAAQEGNAIAMAEIGTMYENGEGVAADAAVAAGWYEMAIKSDSEVALLRLGILYLEGRGVEKDPKRGLELIHRAANMRYAPAIEMLEKLEQ